MFKFFYTCFNAKSLLWCSNLSADNTIILKNNFLKHVLTMLRDKSTPCHRFRELVKTVGRFMAYEISNYLDLEEVNVETPLGVRAQGFKLNEMQNIILVAILRASLPMISGALEVLYNANVGFISAKRLEDDNVSPNFEMEVRIDYFNLPPVDGKTLIIMDPMLATGSTLVKVLRRIHEAGSPKNVFVASIIATPIGIERLTKEFGNLKIFTLAVDKRLNDKGYIVPGLGDAGDRSFNCI